MTFHNTRMRTQGLGDLTRSQGEQVVFTPAMACPCSLNRNRPDPDCKLCGGFGAFWDDDPERKQLLWASVASIKLTRSLQNAGEIEQGDLVLGQELLPFPMLTVNDRIEFTNSLGEPFEPETAVRTGDHCVLSYSPMVVEEVLTGDPLIGRSSVTRYTPYYLEEGALPASLPPDADCYFQWGVRRLFWMPGRGPMDGEYVAIRYRARLEWIVYKTPDPRSVRGTNLSEAVTLQLKHRLLARMRDLNKGREEPKPVDKKRARQNAW